MRLNCKPNYSMLFQSKYLQFFLTSLIYTITILGIRNLNNVTSTNSIVKHLKWNFCEISGRCTYSGNSELMEAHYFSRRFNMRECDLYRILVGSFSSVVKRVAFSYVQRLATNECRSWHERTSSTGLCRSWI